MGHLRPVGISQPWGVGVFCRIKDPSTKAPQNAENRKGWSVSITTSCNFIPALCIGATLWLQAITDAKGQGEKKIVGEDGR